MPPTTQPPKTQSSSPESTKSHELDKKDLGSDADAKAKSEDHKNVTIEELQRIYRESCERVDKMTPEERLKAFPWISKSKP